MRYLPAERRVIWSASDLKAAAECEFAWLRALDARLGRVPKVEEPEDATLERAGRLGTVHERRVLERYRERFPGRVAEIAAVRSSDDAALAEAVACTRRALDSDAAVIYQAAFATEEFVGFADFLVRDESGRWLVQDSKLARHARVTALMQLAAYVDQLDLLGVPRADRVELLLGDGSVSAHRAADLLPVFGLRRERLRALVADRDLDAGAARMPIAWGDERGRLRVFACGRCATCQEEVAAHRDLLGVAGMRPQTRERLRAAGIDTVDALAASAAPAVPGISREAFARLRAQARLQCESEAEAGTVGDSPAPRYEVREPRVLAGLPASDPGDLFFDFEGDPLYTEGETGLWGLDYLFGWVDDREQYTALWAHDLDAECRALEDFLDVVALRRAQHPGMHIYHYAAYETVHLAQIAARHAVRESEVDTLLRDGVFVDLYPLVRQGLVVGSPSYSIKKLEPLYMGSEVRTSDVQRGDDSIVKYVLARELADGGQEAQAQAILDDLADYNRYDCVSTRRLRDWLRSLAAARGVVPGVDEREEQQPYRPSLVAERLRVLAESRESAPDAARALRLAAAAIDFYPREAKSFWLAHFSRLREPLDSWAHTRDVLAVAAELSAVEEEWERPPRARAERRVLALRGEWAPGSSVRAGTQPFALYETPSPWGARDDPRAIYTARPVRVTEVREDAVVLAESVPQGGEPWLGMPVALTPASPPSVTALQGAIDEWAEGLVASVSAARDAEDADRLFPAEPASDLLLRRPPRLRSGGPLCHDTGDAVPDIAASLRLLDRSYLAVQGPPGTGKTYVGAHVVARLVIEDGWRIGVVSQSHNTVEHLLAGVIDAGVPAGLVGKAPKDGDGQAPFTAIGKDGMARFLAHHPDGCVVGGTAWDFSNTRRVERGGLDLLVVDEAGQFSLAQTIAVSVSARNLLLLGDPQQLPQVSQGTHPEPVDTAALSWLMADATVLDAAHGYFLSGTRRMRPELAAVVSELSYDGRLHAHEVAAARHLQGVAPGLVPVPVDHRGNATASPEEAAAVVARVEDLIGREWRDEDAPPRPLTTADVIVVTPYNAQLIAVEDALHAAGIDGVRVGTVDRFQGQEAVVAIVSLAASSGRDAPRGLEFLLLRNRLNVAISRAQHTAYLVYSPGLLDDLPRTPDGVARLSAFTRLVRHRPVADPLA